MSMCEYKILRADTDICCPLPLYGCRVEAGYPSPAGDYLEGTLDLNEHLIRRPAATFFLTVSGESMTGAGIFPNDILVVDRSLDAKHGSIVIAVLDGELTVKRLYRKGGVLRLMPENPQFRPLEIRDGMDFQIWGVVRHAIHSFD
ncbi:translesion error-prone DNA polymerase V autoproteolytic subunit [Emcibacter sp.]|uniref:LexA family protein n=1 Tax=Emcibacter sp. TaxID=1979954 RepID=UPI002AA7DE4A|nr:translesion error-prone DNA polymerase V autoproteolytic subunit [Emcibacter sp.]